MGAAGVDIGGMEEAPVEELPADEPGRGLIRHQIVAEPAPGSATAD